MPSPPPLHPLPSIPHLREDEMALSGLTPLPSVKVRAERGS